MMKCMENKRSNKWGAQRRSEPCIRVREGRGPSAKGCIWRSECWHCGFNQWLDTLEDIEAVGAMTETVLAKAA